jgi:acetate kinase
MLAKPGLKIVTCHLGNGSSVAAVKDGKSVDTCMGFTPLEVLMMGTRSGSIDPAIITFLMDKEGLDTKGINDVLNKKSGALGVSEVSSDFRDIENAAKEGNKKAKLAEEMFCYQVKKLVGAYAAAMGGVDAVVFTAGIGENNGDYRKEIIGGLDFMGLSIDDELNKQRGREIDISKAGSKAKVLVIPTNEELMIALDTKAIVEGK